MKTARLFHIPFTLGTLYWSKEHFNPEMTPATPEQLEKLNIVKDENGLIVKVSVKDTSNA